MGLHLAFTLLYLALSGTLEPEWILYAAITECVAAFLLSIRKQGSFISPYNVQVMALIMLNLGNLSLLHRVSTGTNIMYFFASADDIPEAVSIWCVGNSIFLFAMLAANKMSLPGVGVKFNKTLLTRIFYFLLVISVFPEILSSLFFLPAAITKVIGLSGLVGILFFSRLWASGEGQTYRNYAMILFVAQMYTALFHSYLRLQLIMPIVVLYAGYFAGRRSLAELLSYRIIPLIAIITIFFGAFQQLGANRANFALGFANYYEHLSDDDSDNGDEEAHVPPEKVDRGGLLDRSSTIAQVSQTVKIARVEGFSNGEVSAPLLLALIPRFLWPGKPKIAIGQWFAVKVGAAFYDDNNAVNNSVNITIPGELYIDFGWTGVILGCFLFGVMFSLLWNSAQFDTSFYNLPGTVFGGYLITISLLGLAGDLQIVINYLSFYLVFYTVKRILCAFFV